MSGPQPGPEPTKRPGGTGPEKGERSRALREWIQTGQGIGTLIVSIIALGGAGAGAVIASGGHASPPTLSASTPTALTPVTTTAPASTAVSSPTLPASPSALATGTAAPARAQAATIIRIVIYPGDGLTAVGPAALPSPDKIEISDVPKTITASGVGTLEMDVASLEGPWGACASDCSEWWFSSNSVHVASFSVGGETAHALQSAPVSTGWADLGDGTWTPVYLVWQGGCINLNLTTHDWSNIVPAATCP
jgi:hypothetical protein